MTEVGFYCRRCGTHLNAEEQNAGTEVRCPHCGNILTVPQWGALPMGSERPPSVTVFGILSIIFGGFGLLCTPFALIGAFTSVKGFHEAAWYKGWLVVCSGANVGGAIWLLAIGIGLLGLRRWARSGTVAYAWFIIVLKILDLMAGVVAVASGGLSMPSQAMPAYIGGLFGGLIGLIYPILLLVFMTKPHVIEACDR